MNTQLNNLSIDQLNHVYIETIGYNPTEDGQTREEIIEVLSTYPEPLHGLPETEKSLLKKITDNLDANFFQQIAKFPLPPYHVYQWSRDCDMCESSDVSVHMSYISLVKSYSGYIENLEWAEGPSSWEIVEPQPEFHGTRDRAMEAFENGRGSSLYV